MKTIYIPSKGRAETCTTPDLVNEFGLVSFIVVEPHEIEAYANRFGSSRILTLPESNNGLGYCRQFIKEQSAFNGESWHWQLDDDIRSFLLRVPGGHKKLTAYETLHRVEEEALKYCNVWQAGLNQNSWPPNYNKPIQVNRLPVQAVLNNNAATIASYRDCAPLEDFDYTLQCLSDGYCTLMFDNLRTNCPPIGTIKGGLKEVYEDQDKILSSMEMIKEKFPQLSITWNSKGWHLNRNRIFSTFKQQLVLM